MNSDIFDTIFNFDSTLVMGILNVTPDSFYDGGEASTPEKAIHKAESLIEAGADIIDIGGESTRPGASGAISVDEEIRRVIPVIEHLSRHKNITISVDTSSPVVMNAAVNAGAAIINDVRALQRPGALEAAALLNVPVILMHSLLRQSAPGSNTVYNSGVIFEVIDYLKGRIKACEKAGINRNKIILDPGFGAGMFGKTVEQNLEMLNRFNEFHTLGLPLLAGISRKSFIGDILRKEASERLSGSLAATSLLVYAGAHIIRTHDVAETRDVIKISNAIKNAVHKV